MSAAISIPIETVQDLLDQLEGLCDGDVCIVVEAEGREHRYPIRKITRIASAGEKPKVLIRCSEEVTG